MPRLRRVFPHSPGWTRKRAGAGFSYRDHDGLKLEAQHVERIKALVIPPAWQELWICPHANGHIQAVGTDEAGRRQYLYHPQWRIERDRKKFDRVTEAASQLPKARREMARHLVLEGMPLQRADATAVRLLDLGYFRIGAYAYADAHGSFGLTTLQKRHVTLREKTLVFEFTGKSGVDHVIEIEDEVVIASLERMRKRRGGSDRLLAYQDVSDWLDLDADAVNAYLADLLGGDLTAKDFRTWHATVIATEHLARSEESGETTTSRQRANRGAVKEVAQYLGNTPTVARNSYIDPRVIDLYEDGVTIDAAKLDRMRSLEKRQHAKERAVLSLLREAPESSQRKARAQARKRNA